MKSARLAIAALSTLVAAGVFCFMGRNEPLAFWSFPLLAALSPLLLLSRRSGSHIAARAIWLSTLFFGALSGLCTTGADQTGGLVVALASGLALVSAGGIGLGGHRGASFSPLVARRSLILSLVVVGISAQWLGVLAGIALHGHVSDGDAGVAAFCLLGLATLGLGFFGVLRLQVWGFVLIALGCLTLASLSGLGAVFAGGMDKTAVLAAVTTFFAVPVVVTARVLIACLPGRPARR